MTILNDYMVTDYPDACIFLILVLIATILFSAVVLVDTIGNKRRMKTRVICLLFILVSFAGIFSIKEFFAVTERYLEVTLDDDVPFTEITYRYELVSQRGDIWVLRFRDEE